MSGQIPSKGRFREGYKGGYKPARVRECWAPLWLWGPDWSYLLPRQAGGVPFGSREMEVAARRPEVPQRDARSGPLEPLLLASSQLKGPRQRNSPSLLLAMRVKELRLKAHLDCWGWGRGGGRAQETVLHLLHLERLWLRWIVRSVVESWTEQEEEPGRSLRGAILEGEALQGRF